MELPGAFFAALTVDFVPFFSFLSLLVALLASLCVLHHKADGLRVKFIYLQIQRTFLV